MSSLLGSASSGSGSKLAALFASESRPVKQSARQTTTRNGTTKSDSSVGGLAGASVTDTMNIEADSKPRSKSKRKAPGADVFVPTEADREHEQSRERKRRRKRDEDDLEGAYMQRVAREEAKEEQQKLEERRRAQQAAAPAVVEAPAQDPAEEEEEDGGVAVEDLEDGDDDEEEEAYEIPQHESVANGNGENPDLEKAARTVFLGNVSTTAITAKADKKALMDHLASHLTDMPESKPPHKIESIRFRSTAYATPVPKKAAFARQEIMDATTKSTNAYVVYSTKQAAREAARKLNGTVVLDRHLRVDEVAHPAKVDHHRCVFVGNLSFVDDESSMKDAEGKEGEKKRPSKPRNGDVEEGLWRQFGKAGTVESVRVVRDAKTRVSKGFAYVQFSDENAVEAALLFNEKKFPPLLPRTLRVVRAKKFKKNDTKPQTGPPGRRIDDRKRASNQRSTEDKSHQGRVKKLLGRAGGANAGAHRDFKKPEAFVFEGHRASSTQGNGLGRNGKPKKKAGKPTDRSAKRGAAWKAKGGEKSKK